jgi:hypothetical protein
MGFLFFIPEIPIDKPMIQRFINAAPFLPHQKAGYLFPDIRSNE